MKRREFLARCAALGASLPVFSFLQACASGGQLYADFDDFVNALTLELNGVNAARSMYARGHYNADTNVFTAYKIFVYIIEP